MKKPDYSKKPVDLNKFLEEEELKISSDEEETTTKSNKKTEPALITVSSVAQAGKAILIIVCIYGGIYLVKDWASNMKLDFTNPPTEVTGTVKYDDCREQITLNSTDYSKQHGTFVCNDQKTNSGKSMGGECVKTVLDNGGKCQTAYVYTKEAEEKCGDNSYLTIDDKCSCSLGNVSSGGSCITYDQSCKDSFGPNSYGGETRDSNGYITSLFNNTCYCSSGYMWNSDKTYCVSY